MQRLTAFVLMAALVALVPAPAFAAPQAGQLTGTVRDTDDRPVRNVLVRLRNLETGAVSGTSVTNSGGAFAFTSVAPGNYVLEVVDASGAILGTGAAFVVSAGQGLSGLLVTIAESTRRAGLLAFFGTTPGIVVAAAAGGAIGFAIYQATKSASR